MADLYPMGGLTNLNTSRDVITHIGVEAFRKHTWISMMGKAFDAADKERAALTARGPWTARTDSIRGYAFDAYA